MERSLCFGSFTWAKQHFASFNQLNKPYLMGWNVHKMTDACNRHEPNWKRDVGGGAPHPPTYSPSLPYCNLHSLPWKHARPRLVNSLAPSPLLTFLSIDIFLSLSRNTISHRVQQHVWPPHRLRAFLEKSHSLSNWQAGAGAYRKMSWRQQRRSCCTLCSVHDVIKWCRQTEQNHIIRFGSIQSLTFYQVKTSF